MLVLPACGGGDDSASAGGGGAPTPTGTSCASLANRNIGGAQITGAGDMLVGAANACVVTGHVDPAINFELTIPCDWNGKLLYLGTGGFGGAIPKATATGSPGMLGDATCDGKGTGYAIVADDTGHPGTGSFEASWVLASPAVVDDFAFRSVHVVQAAAREIVRIRTGQAVSRAYFEGCSNGGREALISAQRYPADFDGIIARAPVVDMTGLMTAANRFARQLAQPGARPSRDKLQLLGSAQLAACDATDGLADGIIGLPSTCAAVLDSLRCPAGTDAPGCLTDAEIETFKTVRSETSLPYAQAHNLSAYPGYPPGHEQDFGSWPVWILDGAPTASPPLPPLKMNSQDQFMRYFIAGNASADPLQMVLANFAPALERESRRLDATNPDLGPFFDRGGRLILWHGLADPALSANDTTAYVDAVRTSRAAQADASMRYYTSPGVLHCSQGPGADTIDLVTPLDNWVTSGAAPGAITARRYSKNQDGSPRTDLPPIISRPLCRYPEYPHYNGAGDPADAASFTCRIP
jgi:feruloyl esterase